MIEKGEEKSWKSFAVTISLVERNLTFSLL